ncbi:magnesium-translocating P-type ATPase [Thermoanaerobacterium xylanolyticum LX-11]|uniref:Magnesium-transporting ATPase, P-type 1 n=1 Tax=Thermoanaerobacterium xylanolyticum (strain ATCC 49914 / DSM 7097 / LX-11) TaxID=858215 RepID=F6BIQ2_THEXL|nr:magnesium-translocating P-type ATPase [Thermoanaerobacterium xylanolyticum]AEF16796.1 magnesium-translocating P-type ATPase [Thermoanaerobacterium xylanolyticum LX-11]
MFKNIGIINTQKTNTSEQFLKYSDMNIDELLKTLDTSISGLNEDDVKVKKEIFGSNEIATGKKETVLHKLFTAFVNPFNVVLMVLAVVSLFTDVLLVSPTDRDPSSVIIISIMVLISGILRFVQEWRSEKASEELKALVKLTTLVERKDTGRKEIPISDLVPGDIVHLAAGDIVPADVRVIKTKDLFIDQAVLTGESEPVEKFDNLLQSKSLKDIKNPLDRNNLAFMGSNIVSGTATCVVIATGDSTYFGALSKTLTSKREATSFEKGVNSVSWILIRFMAIMVPVVFFINGFTKGNWLEAFLFGLSVAVGLTPEMLPMIVTTNLAKGAVAMSKKKTIVKRLSSMQNFGAMDVLCTDKTGTLTKNKIVLEKYMDVHGNEDSRVLRHAYINSYFQTGLKNVMDRAILNHVGEEFSWIQSNYEKVDEIPFDFTRRRMSVVVKDRNGKTQLITKGAVEEMLSISKFAEYHGEVIPLTEELRKEILDTVNKFNSEGLRVIAVAQKTNPPVEGVFSSDDESDMVLIGYLAFFDPPKDNVEEVVRTLKDYGINLKILTGDNDGVTVAIAKKVGLDIQNILLGSQLDKMDDNTLKELVEKTTIFAKLTPEHKARIVKILRENGHVVGFMGDGINDAPAMHVADVAISVDNAVDIAKDTADIILLEKDLLVLENGVVEGRKIFGNIMKYISITASSNFGNMFSVLVASSFLPFLPMQPLQILFLNLTYDLSMTLIPWDNMDKEYLEKPRNWDASNISKFMIWLGPTSSIFDITTYALMLFLIGPMTFGSSYFMLSGTLRDNFVSLFQTGWFVESLWTQTMVVYMLRTEKIPFIQSLPAIPLLLSTLTAIVIGTIIPYTAFGKQLGMLPLPVLYFLFLAITIFSYLALSQFVKTKFINKYGTLL